MNEAQSFTEFILGEALHSDEETATVAVSAGPALDVAGDLFPAAQVEVADAKVRSFGKVHRLAQCGQELLFDVIENPRHHSVIAKIAASHETVLDGAVAQPLGSGDVRGVEQRLGLPHCEPVSQADPLGCDPLNPRNP